MKVLVIPEYGVFGGTLSFFKRLVEIHKNNGIKTAVLIQKKQQYPELMGFLNSMGIDIYTVANRGEFFRKPLFSLLYDILFCWKAFLSFRPNLIVVSNGTPGLMLGVLLFPVPVMFFMHTYPMSKMHLPFRLLWNLVSRFENLFVTVSNFSVNQISTCMSVSTDRIKIIYNSFRATNTQIKKTNTNPVVLTVGHVVAYKNPERWLDVALKVIAQRPDVTFVWLGEGSLLETMRKRGKEKGVDGRVIFKGYCSKVENYYDTAMVYFQPSLIESHGISVVEAMAHGLPCVASDVGGMPESIVDGVTGYTCAQNDIDGFVEKIVSLLDCEDLRVKMGRAGNVRAERLFSEATQEEKIVAFYKSMLQKSCTIKSSVCHESVQKMRASRNGLSGEGVQTTPKLR